MIKTIEVHSENHKWNIKYTSVLDIISALVDDVIKVFSFQYYEMSNKDIKIKSSYVKISWNISYLPWKFLFAKFFKTGQTLKFISVNVLKTHHRVSSFKVKIYNRVDLKD